MSKLKETLNTPHKEIEFAIWCETCQNWQSKFEISDDGNFIVCNDCGDGLVMVIK